MSKTAQVTLWLLFACILVVVISVALVTIDLDRITEKAIEAYGTEAAGVAVSVADADVSIGERQARIDGVKVESPPGFLSKHVLGFGTIDVALNVETSNEDLVVIACLIVNDAHITIENSARGQTNLEIILERESWGQVFTLAFRAEKRGRPERRPKPVVDQAVEFRYLERVSSPPEPRVMGGCSRGHPLSVDRGRYRLGIELRNLQLRMLTLLGEGEGNTTSHVMQVAGRFSG